MTEVAERTFRWANAGSVRVCVHGLTNPFDEEWRAYVDDLAVNGRALKGILVYTAGGGPNAAQRKYLAELWTRRGSMLPVALMSPSTVVRGMVTALNWVLPKPIRTFPPDQPDEAVRFLQLDAAESRAALAKLNEFRDVLGITPQANRRVG
ncbi:MAG TPA: STAS/SEC14 domain-containing protein [Polyangiaceae bacterium]|nr:STAS/SEC14 domain-containing protein [Polyangiaceae bacterium]